VPVSAHGKRQARGQILNTEPVVGDPEMARYSKKAGEEVERAMRERKKGTLRTGTGKKVTSRKQAVAIGLSEAREKGAKVPKQKKKAGKS
jgi:hypothetical protein